MTPTLVVTLIGAGVTLRGPYRYPLIHPHEFLLMAIPLMDIRLMDIQLRGPPTARISISDWIMRGAKRLTIERMVPAGNNWRKTMHASPGLSVNSAYAEFA